MCQWLLTKKKIANDQPNQFGWFAPLQRVQMMTMQMLSIAKELSSISWAQSCVPDQSF